jgi:hypothetical protein
LSSLSPGEYSEESEGYGVLRDPAVSPRAKIDFGAKLTSRMTSLSTEGLNSKRTIWTIVMISDFRERRWGEVGR